MTQTATAPDVRSGPASAAHAPPAERRADDGPARAERGSGAPELSVVVATDARGGVAQAIGRFRGPLDAQDAPYEVVVVADAARAAQIAELTALAEDWPELSVIGFRPWNGEDAALSTALRRSSGGRVLILPGWPQVDPADLPRLLEALGPHDMVSAMRVEEGDDGARGRLQSLRQGLFARLLRRLFGRAPSDPFCRVHLGQRDTVEDVAAFGTRQHFLPVIAAQRGHDVAEAPMRPAPSEQAGEAPYVFKPLGHLRALLDALTLYVVLTFLRRPLRFFGAIGLPLFAAGALITVWLVATRLFGDTALADRPALIFAVMLAVLGVQIIAIGLVGEIIVFSNARRLKQYEVAEIITSGDRPGCPGETPAAAPEAVSDPVTGPTATSTARSDGGSEATGGAAA
jgi:hypothetical protein